MKQKADISLLAIICVFLVLLCLEPLIKIPNHIIPTHFLTCVLTILLFMGFSNPFEQSTKEIREIQKNGNLAVRLTIALVLSFLLLFVRLAIPLYFIIEENLTYNNTNLVLLSLIIKTYIYAMSEEMIFSYGLGKLFKEIKLPKYISWPIICIIFASAHFIGKKFVALDFIVIAVIRLLFLTIFNLFPSIILISSVHFGTNIVNALLIDML